MATPNKVITEKLVSEKNHDKQSDLESITLTTFDDIYVLLKNIHTKHSLLAIMIDGSDEFYGSTIIELNKDEKYLVIDELYPEEGHAQIEVGKPLSFDANYAGAFVHFKGNVEAIGKNDKAAYYKINIPEEVEYHQRRNTFRISTSISDPILVNLVNEDEVLIKAELRDVSHGGLCLRVNDASHISIQSNDHMPTCLIQIDENRKILTSLNICHVEKIQASGSLRIGAEFAKMSKIDRRELEHLIASLERAIIKKIKRADTRISI
jgi:c-di-GMP-binding flagellar brake protein YcgR